MFRYYKSFTKFKKTIFFEEFYNTSSSTAEVILIKVQQIQIWKNILLRFMKNWKNSIVPYVILDSELKRFLRLMEENFMTLLTSKVQSIYFAIYAMPNLQCKGICRDIMKQFMRKKGHLLVHYVIKSFH